MLLFSLGFSWFIAAWGVFIKDMSQIIPMFVQMLMFLCPVFYPVSAVPKTLQPFYQYNPLSIVIEAARAAVMGQPIDWATWSIALIFGLITLLLGFTFFQHGRDEFADAL